MNRRAFAAALFAAVTLMTVPSCGGPPTKPDPGPIVQPPPPPPPPPPAPPTLAVTRILAFGDSLTEGESLGQLLRGLHDHGTAGIPVSYPFKLQTGLTAIYTSQTIRVFNGGVGGEPVDRSSTRDRFLREIATYQPEVILLLHGVNDLIAGYLTPAATVTRTAGAIEELIELAHARGVHVILGNLPIERDTPKARGFALVVPFNAALRDVAIEEGATLVDLYSVITLDMLMPDGLHITETGNQKIADTFYAALKSRYHREPQ